MNINKVYLGINVSHLKIEKDICTKRLAIGIPAFKWHDIIGKIAKKKFKINEKIST
jgi:hypothetical protein